jgi:excinuclease ABC subunit C
VSETELKQKALSLPLLPGVYIMLDSSGGVLYVGKAKQLKSRVVSYFQESADHSWKTQVLVTQIADFDVIVVGSEIEALVMESSLIKRHQPKYNILLKDDKGFPFIHLPAGEEYPRFTLVAGPAGKGRFFGPFGGRSMSRTVIATLCETLKLPVCSRAFPREIGRGRPCLQYHMKRCIGVCRGGVAPAEYNQRITQAVLLLEGKYSDLAESLRVEMEQAAGELRFETAAQLRDRLNAIERLGIQQKVIACILPDTDIIGFAAADGRLCAAVLHYMEGQPVDKDSVVFEEAVEVSETEQLGAFVKQFYLARGVLPNEILLPFPIEDMEDLSRLLSGQAGRKVTLKIPKRGDRAALLLLAGENAKAELESAASKEEKIRRPLLELARVLTLKAPPQRIESCDISNLGSGEGSDRVGGLVVFLNGRASKKDYKRFEIKGEAPDDLSAMRELLARRFARAREGDPGFTELPDLLLVDGGMLQAAAACSVVEAHGLNIPVCGMAKDGRHKTRALVNARGDEADLRTLPGLYSFIGTVQEETHRYALAYHRQKRGKKVKASVLDGIAGVGEKRKMALLQAFGSVKNIRGKTIEELCAVIPQYAAQAVWEQLNKRGK